MHDNNRYNAHAFHESFVRGRASGILTVSEASIRFRNDQGAVVMPITGITFKLGGASDRLIYITHAKHPDWTLYTSDRSLLNNVVFANNLEIQAQKAKIVNKRVFNGSMLVAVCAIIVLIPLSVFFFMDTLTRSVAAKIPVQWEQELGEKAFAQYKVEHNILQHADAVKTLDRLVQPLLGHVLGNRYTFKIHISDAAELNAFALPGGNIVINSGLILKAKNANEMLGVLAHELSHVTEQHGVRNIIAASGTFLLVQALIGDSTGIMATLAGAAPLLLSQKYSRDFESDADKKGVALLLRANVSPQGLVDFFKRIKREKQEMLDAIDNNNQRRLAELALGYLSTHPATDDRISIIESLLEKNQSTHFINFNEDFFALQDHVKNFVTEGDGQ